jgi:hypothetical protein
MRCAPARPTLKLAVSLLRGSLIFFLLVACAGYATDCHAQKRMALVIGNERYESISSVPRAKKDARDVAAALGALGFLPVTVHFDLPRSATTTALEVFASQIGPDDTVVFYFSGNGVALNSQNLVLAVDAPAARAREESRIADAGLSVADILATFQRQGAKVLAIIDASRSNPFDRPGGRPLELPTGLIRMDGIPPAAYVIFSAGPGEKSRIRTDPKDLSSNSIFARVLLSRIAEANLSIGALALALQSGVRELSATSNAKQTPVLFDNGIGGLYLSGKKIVKYPDKLRLKVKPDGGKRYKLSEIVPMEDELPGKEECEALGQKYADQLRREVGDSVRFWIRIKRADIGYCRLSQNQWYVDYFDRNIQDALVLDLKN